MAMFNSKRLSGIPVATRDGRTLGRVSSMDFDSDTGHLAALRVSTGFVKGLLHDELAISWNQVVEIQEDVVIVSDNAVPAGFAAVATA